MKLGLLRTAALHANICPLNIKETGILNCGTLGANSRARDGSAYSRDKIFSVMDEDGIGKRWTHRTGRFVLWNSTHFCVQSCTSRTLDNCTMRILYIQSAEHKLN